MSVGQPILICSAISLNRFALACQGWSNMDNITRILSLLKDVKLVGVADINIERGLDTPANTGCVFEDYRPPPHVEAVLLPFPPAITLSG